MNPNQLERYSFWWSEVRLVIAAAALLLGGVPPVFYLLPGMYGITAPLLKICWIISGVVSAYLGYRWYQNDMRVFGGKDTWDIVAFAILVVTGINLGLTGLLGNNIGMSILGGRTVFFIVGLIYIAVAVYIYRRWKASGERMF